MTDRQVDGQTDRQKHIVGL